MKKLFTFLVIFLSGMNSIAQSCSAVDSSFGIGGRAINTSFSNYYLGSIDLIIQPDGKILQLGTAYTGSLNSLFMQRFNADGSPDQGFGNAGAVLVPLPYNGYVTAAALQPDGKIMVSGNKFTSNDFFLMRFNGNGSPDPVMGNWNNLKGIVTNSGSLRVQDDGKILIMGVDYDSTNLCEMENYFYPKVAVVRINNNGGVDSSFGQKGKLEFGTGQYYDYARKMILQPDGKILLWSTAGYNCNCAPGYYGGLEWICNSSYFLLQRFNTDGSLDKTFGKEGKIADSSLLSLASELILQPDGKIVVTGTNALYVNTKRFNSDGSPDMSFGSGGLSTINPDQIADYINTNSIAVQPDGKILLAVNYSFYNGSVNATLVRLNSNGITDSSFAVNGKSSFIFGAFNNRDYITSMVMQGDNLFVGGQTNNRSNNFVVRIRKKIQELIPTVTINGPTTFCFGDSVNLTSDLPGSAQWYNNGIAINGATNIKYTAKFNGFYQLQINNSDGCGISGRIGITVYPLINAPYINWDGTVLSIDSGFAGYQWYRNGEEIPGATSRSYNPGSNIGMFKVRIVDGHGCNNFSYEFNMVVTNVADITVGDSKLRFYPNPSSSVLNIDLTQPSGKKLAAEIYDLSGRLIKSQALDNGHNEILLTGIFTGMYGLVIKSGKDKTVRKLIVVK
jgi:uncharacterized delta-60 repeat protein